jgi:hypothetical protein
MGLDMYLFASRPIYSFGQPGTDNDIENAVTKILNLPNAVNVDSIKLEVCYWRKDNQIHDWFVKNVQNGTDDCGTYKVTKYDLITLGDTCKKVLEDRTLASKLLPTTAGFFFGATEYKDYYFSALEETIEKINTALSLGDNWNYEYHSSW